MRADKNFRRKILKTEFPHFYYVPSFFQSVYIIVKPESVRIHNAPFRQKGNVQITALFFKLQIISLLASVLYVNPLKNRFITVKFSPKIIRTRNKIMNGKRRSSKIFAVQKYRSSRNVRFYDDSRFSARNFAFQFRLCRFSAVRNAQIRR